MAEQARRARRNKACAARDCNCQCHWHTRWATTCHPGRRCRDVVCECGKFKRLTIDAVITIPAISVWRGGIRYR